MSELLPSIGDEISELLEREARIDRAQRNAYYEIGLELSAIRDRKLYKTQREQPVGGRYSFTTFEEYVDERWDMEHRRANQLIECARAVDALENGKNFSCFPSRESHVRELLKIEGDDHRAAVWRRVLDRGETIRAATVKEEVERYQAELAKEYITLDEWDAMSQADRKAALLVRSDGKLNKQDSDSIEWAQWSWNPITGCKHDCPYCYARDIANRFYPQKFVPSLYACRLSRPANTNVPKEAEDNVAYRNVFTGSMADIFGRWVPDEWIDAVLQVVADNSQWNFLFLTKFPQRVHEFGQVPDNAWMGTTVDCQQRVKNAEDAFAKMGGGIKWLSVEPMLTPLEFSRLELFDWVVIGGSSRSSSTPEWQPPFDWIVDLHNQARDAGCAIYHKTNLGFENRLMEFPWSERPAIRQLPESLKYLGMRTKE